MVSKGLSNVKTCEPSSLPQGSDGQALGVEESAFQGSVSEEGLKQECALCRENCEAVCMGGVSQRRCDRSPSKQSWTGAIAIIIPIFTQEETKA